MLEMEIHTLIEQSADPVAISLPGVKEKFTLKY